MQIRGKYSKAKAYGAAKYVRNLEFHKETGEVVEGQQLLWVDYEKLAEGEKCGGYHSIVTIELHKSDADTIGSYCGLRKNKDTLKIAKSPLEARPVYVPLEDRIDAHLPSCIISLMIVRLLQEVTYRPYLTGRIIECLGRISCSHDQENLYLLDCRSETSDAISNVLGFDFTRNRLRTAYINNILGNSKRLSAPRIFAQKYEDANPFLLGLRPLFNLLCFQSQDIMSRHNTLNRNYDDVFKSAN